MKIIEAIQEAYGPEYTTLEDAIHWWSGPRAWREDFTAVLILRSGKRPYKQHLSEVQFDDDEHLMQAASTSAGCRTGRLLGKLTPTPEAFTRWTGMMPSAIWHGYTGRRTAGSAAHTALRCTMCRVGQLSCSGITAPGASSVLTIAAKGGEAIMKPKKRAGCFNCLLCPKHRGGFR